MDQLNQARGIIQAQKERETDTLMLNNLIKVTRYYKILCNY